MNATTPTHEAAERRARVRTALIYSGLLDLALAGFFLGWGAPLLELEYRAAWLIAALLAVGGVAVLLTATLAYGRRGTGRALDEGEDDPPPVIRR